MSAKHADVNSFAKKFWDASSPSEGTIVSKIDALLDSIEFVMSDEAIFYLFTTLYISRSPIIIIITSSPHTRPIYSAS